MKIYYAHSIRWQHQEWEWTALEVLSYLQWLGHEVLSEEIWTTHAALTDEEIYARDTAMIRDCDMVLANVTNTSLWVWYELWYAEALGKKIICFYQSNLVDRVSAMISGNPKFKVYAINAIDQIKPVLSS